MLEEFASITDIGYFNDKERSSIKSYNIYYNKMINVSPTALSELLVA